MKEILWDCFEIEINIFQGFAMIYFPFRFLGGKFSNKFTENYGVPFAILLAFVISIFNKITFFEHIYAVLYGLIIYIFSLLCLKNNIYNKLFASTFSLIIPIVSAAAVAGLMSVTFNKSFEQIIIEDDRIRAFGLIFTQLLVFYLYYISLRIFRRNQGNEYRLTKSEAFLISATLIMSIIIGSILCTIAIEHADSKSKLLVIIGFSCIILINIVTIYIAVDLRSKNNIETQNEKLRIMLTYNKQYIENVDAEYQLIRKLRHDTKDSYHVINDYLENGDISSAKEYIRKMVKIADDRVLFVNTDNKVVNSVINSKLTVAKSFGINTTCICINDFKGIDDIDLCRLLSNMLENAVTATSEAHLKEKQILLKITCDADKYVFLLKNTIDNSVLNENPELHTTKTQVDSHGYGVRIIRDIAKHYNGHCDFFEEENMFCCLVMLNQV